MPRTTCAHCGGTLVWYWTDAFDKFGFEDGDGMVMTDTVSRILIEAGYTVEFVSWGFHNTVITSIQKDGAEQIPTTTAVGYDDPRSYLPQKIINLLDQKLGNAVEVTL